MTDDASGDRVWMDDISSAFVGEHIERDGISVEVEHVTAIDDDPRDDDARYTLEVRAYKSE
ncbi:hypothetical protein [Halapricum desulfuricans]|nr:hypothetical protein [Halapricum desulfuricans]